MWKGISVVSISRAIAGSVCLVAICLCLLPGSSLGGWFPSGRLTYDAANSTTSGNNAWCVAGDDSGRFHIVWEDRRDGNAEIYYKSYDGIAWTPCLRLSALLFDSADPAVAAGDSGTVHVVWKDRRDGFTEIYYKRFDGAVWGSDTRLTVSTAESSYPSVCAAGGKVHVAWVDRRTGVSEVYYKCHDGISWSGDTRVSATSGVTFYPSVAADDSGRVHLAWYDYALGKRGVYYAHFNGSVWSAQEHLTPATVSAQNPSIAVDDTGGVHIAWYDYRDMDFEIYYKRGDGAVWSADLRVTAAVGASHNPSICIDENGAPHIVWHDNRTGRFEIYHKMFDGVSWGTATVLSDLSHSSLNASIAAASGYTGVVWYDDLSGNGEIFWARTFDEPLAPPQVASVVPDSAMTNEVVQDLRIAGSGFVFPDSVWLQRTGHPRVVADSVIVVSSDSIVCRLDLRGVHYGDYDLTVRNPDGQTALLCSGFTVRPLPEGPYLTSVDPASAMTGTITGTITLSGGNFADPVSVWFARNGETGPDAFDETVETEEMVDFRIDLGGVDPGEYDVVLQNADGKRDTLTDGFAVLPGWSDETRLTDYADDSRLSRTHARSIATDAEGMLHVVWFDYRHGDPEIYYKRHDGAAWEAEQRLTNSVGLATDPAVATGPQSDVHVVWTDTRLGYEQVYYMRYSEGAWDPAMRLTETDRDCYKPAVAADAGGNVHVVWCDERTGIADIYYREFDGMAWGADINLSNDPDQCGEASVDVDGYGTVHVAWVAGYTLMEVYHIANDGTWGSVTQLSNAWKHVRTPSLYATDAGIVFVAWREELDEGVHDIFVRKYDGVLWQPFERATRMHACGQPSIVADSDGNVHLTWRLYYVTGQDLYYKLYDGSEWSSNAAITDLVSFTDKGSLALDQHGNTHLVWEDDKAGHFDIYYAYRDAPALARVTGDEITRPRVNVLRVMPNPVATEAVLHFNASAAARARISIYDILGRRVWSHDAGDIEPGSHSVRWGRCDTSGRSVSPGVYFARLEIGGTVSTAKMLLLR